MTFYNYITNTLKIYNNFVKYILQYDYNRLYNFRKIQNIYNDKLKGVYL